MESVERKSLKQQGHQIYYGWGTPLHRYVDTRSYLGKGQASQRTHAGEPSVSPDHSRIRIKTKIYPKSFFCFVFVKGQRQK